MLLPRVMVRGVMTNATKKLCGWAVEPNKSQQYHQEHVRERPTLNSKGKPLSGTKQGSSVVRRHQK